MILRAVAKRFQVRDKLLKVITCNQNAKKHESVCCLTMTCRALAGIDSRCFACA